MAATNISPLAIVDEKGIRSGKNTTGSTIVKGTLVKLKSSPTVKGEITPCTAATDPFYGVTMQDIKDGEWGDVQTEGVALVLCGATISAPTRVTMNASGQAVAASTGNIAVGILVTDGASGALSEVELAGPLGAVTP